MQIPYEKNSVALLVIDMQEHFRHIAKQIISDIETLVKNCHDRNLPVIWTQHGHRKFVSWGVGNSIKYGSESWKILEELQTQVQRSPESLNHKDFIIFKSRYDAFYGTELDSLLSSLGVKTIIISGVMTNLCCESTAKSGFFHNYNVVFLDDGCATVNKEMHETTLINLQCGFATVAKIKDVLNWL